MDDADDHKHGRTLTKCGGLLVGCRTKLKCKKGWLLARRRLLGSARSPQMMVSTIQEYRLVMKVPVQDRWADASSAGEVYYPGPLGALNRRSYAMYTGPHADTMFTAHGQSGAELRRRLRPCCRKTKTEDENSSRSRKGQRHAQLVVALQRHKHHVASSDPWLICARLVSNNRSRRSIPTAPTALVSLLGSLRNSSRVSALLSLPLEPPLSSALLSSLMLH